jgi:GNAT superfamily N-acetyltransferase
MKDERTPLAGSNVQIATVTLDDIEDVARLAAEVWWHHYPSIITPAQIEYMLKQRYDLALLRAELQRRDLWWDGLRLDGTLVAFSSCFLVAEARALKLDKLYVHPAQQRKGYGGLLIARVCERARAQGCARVTLAVNKKNSSAIAAYLKHGFTVAESVVTDIGGGFVMDDYIMEKCA